MTLLRRALRMEGPDWIKDVVSYSGTTKLADFFVGGVGTISWRGLDWPSSVNHSVPITLLCNLLKPGPIRSLIGLLNWVFFLFPHTYLDITHTCTRVEFSMFSAFEANFNTRIFNIPFEDVPIFSFLRNLFLSCPLIPPPVLPSYPSASAPSWPQRLDTLAV